MIEPAQKHRPLNYMQTGEGITWDMRADAGTCLDGANCGVAYLTLDGRCLRANPVLRDILGYSCEELTGFSFDDVCEPSRRMRTKVCAQNLLEGSADTVWLYHHLIHRTGKSVPVSVSLSIARNCTGQPLYFIACIQEVCSDTINENRWPPATQGREHDSAQGAFLRDLLSSVSGGRFKLCEGPHELPEPIEKDPETFELSQNTLRELRRRLQDKATTAGFDEKRWQDIVTAAGEAAVNAIVHGGGGSVQLHVSSKGTIQVWITDKGTGIAAQNLRRATLERGFTTTGTLGHGFWMMRQFADRIWLLTGSEGTTVVLEKYVNGIDPSNPDGDGHER